MYKLSDIKDTLVSKEGVYKYISDYDILKYYSPSTNEYKQTICCIFHKERTPSLTIDYLKGMYKCFSCGKSGRGVQFVMDKFNCTFPEALRIIINDFRLPIDIGEYKEPSLNYIGLADKSIPEYQQTETLIEIKSKAYTVAELNYWGQYGISKELLDYHNVKSLKFYRINGYTFYSKPTIPIFCYEFVDKKRKIYLPLNDKGLKWFGNAGQDIVQGDLQLPRSGELLIITSSLKDVMSLHSLELSNNIEAVAPSSETSFILDDKIDDYKQRFNRIIVYFNNDDAGIQAAINYKERYGFEYIYNPKNEPKDPSDVIKAGKKNELVKFLDNKLWTV
jgi:hypothetical protein